MQELVKAFGKGAGDTSLILPIHDDKGCSSRELVLPGSLVKLCYLDVREYTQKK